MKLRDKLIEETIADRRIAYPHSTSVEVNEFTCILGISKNGIDYNSSDGQDCHLILLTLSPADDTTEHRKIISCFRSMVQNLDIRSSLYGPDSHDEILNGKRMIIERMT